MGEICPMEEGGTLQAVTDMEMKKLQIHIDSGSVDTVCPKNFHPEGLMRETPESKRGNYYLAANNSKIPVYGRKTIQGVTDEWNNLKVEAEVADVRRALGSVKRLCDAGNTVVFSGQESYIENDNTGKRTKIEHNGKGYVVNIWVPHVQGQAHP